MFALALFLLMLGFQVAFVFAGVALFFALISDEVGSACFRDASLQNLWDHGQCYADGYPAIYFHGVDT